MRQLELIQFPGAGRLESFSPFCVKAQRVLNYKRLPYAVRNVNMPLPRGTGEVEAFPKLRAWYERVGALTRRAPEPASAAA